MTYFLAAAIYLGRLSLLSLIVTIIDRMTRAISD